MLDVIHCQAVDLTMGWVFHCPTVQGIQGAGHTYRQSVATSEHCARQHLSRGAGYELELADVARQLRHTRRHQLRDGQCR
jgi:hypothetical protein